MFGQLGLGRAGRTGGKDAKNLRLGGKKRPPVLHKLPQLNWRFAVPMYRSWPEEKDPGRLVLKTPGRVPESKVRYGGTGSTRRKQ